MVNSNLATLSSVIELTVENMLKDLHTSMPGIIETFDPSSQTATVQPAIKRVFITTDGTGIDILTPSNLPVLINVPVSFPRGGGYSLTFPVAKGDECLLHFCERTIDNWHEFGGIKTPNSKRMHSLSDAVAYVGVSSKVNKISDYSSNSVVLRSDDNDDSISIGAGGITIKTTGTFEVDATQINLKSGVGTVAVTGAKLTSPNIEAATSLKASGKEIVGHKHGHTLVANLTTGAVTGTVDANI